MVTLTHYCAQRGVKLNIFEVKIHNYKKYNDGLPEWCFKKEKITYVYQHYLDFLRNRKDYCQKFMTNPYDGLYWYLKQYYTDVQIALKMSVHSRKYKNFFSWSVFLSQDLWHVREDSDERLGWSMMVDFFRNGSILLFLTAKKYGIRELEND